MWLLSHTAKTFKETEPLLMPAQCTVLIQNQAHSWLHNAMQQQKHFFVLFDLDILNYKTLQSVTQDPEKVSYFRDKRQKAISSQMNY